MIIIIGLVVLIAAVAVGVAGVVANSSENHLLSDDFAVFDFHFHGSSGLLFGYGIVVGAIGTIGLALVLTGAWRVSRRSAVARRELAQSRREIAAVRRDLGKSAPPAGKEPVVRPSIEPATRPRRESVWGRFTRRSATARSGDAVPAGSAPRAQAPTSK
ncbi:hypothetical protein F5X71_06655 [Nocardia brasiliensis]|uniref:Uncharacterized protein n=1 Tax=Nocardia brasiliensis TaxID=37326 RepID=A0A6G9XMA8_NOCBR|nr:hypothetical protein [Nocardia brasiliensis]QIS02038.1 hypothetical protein F5X71_06655 [Nocardia brasiliensis]